MQRSGHKPILPMATIAERIESTLRDSPADETEIVWLEALQGRARAHRSKIDTRVAPQRTILVRVLDRGRVGSYRLGTAAPNALADGVRNAVAQSRVRQPLNGLTHLPADNGDFQTPVSLHDSAIAELGKRKVDNLLKGLALKRENGHFHWTEARVAVCNSRGIQRLAQATAATFQVRTGRRPGAARVGDSARSLDGLDMPALVETARELHQRSETAELPVTQVPAVLSSLATTSLCALLNDTSFSAKAYYDGTSFLREHINIQVFDRRFNLCDDGTDPGGIPFPFDLEGTIKRPVDLILKGAPKTPTLDQRQAAVLGLPGTAHAIGGNNARAENLFLRAGEASLDDLLAAADGGLWIGWLEGVESLDPKRVRFRARARGVRAIRDGKLDAPLPDFFLEDSLLRAFASVLGIGDVPTRQLSADGYLGGISAPPVAIAGLAPQPAVAS